MWCSARRRSARTGTKSRRRPGGRLARGDEVAEDAARLARLDDEWMVVDGQPPGQTGDFPNVYTAADVIDRAAAERMLWALLATRGVTQCRFVWKRMGFIVTPV